MNIIEIGLGNNINEKENENVASLQFSKSDRISTNERSRSRNHIPNSRQNWTNQSMLCRKRKVDWREDNLDPRTAKQTRCNLGKTE